MHEPGSEGLDVFGPGQRLVVVSPHLDDGVLSLGGSISHLARRKVHVRVVTAFAGAPENDLKAGWWDRLGGFATAADAFRTRREEDRRACAIVGAEPVWLPFFDDQYGCPGARRTVVQQLRSVCAGAHAVLVPGFPLSHVEHAWLARAIVEHGVEAERLGLYAEQPYLWRHGGRPALVEPLASVVETHVHWTTVRLEARDRRAKRRAIAAYASQKHLFGKFAFIRMALDEQRRGGETLAWLDQRPSASG